MNIINIFVFFYKKIIYISNLRVTIATYNYCLFINDILIKSNIYRELLVFLINYIN